MQPENQTPLAVVAEVEEEDPEEEEEHSPSAMMFLIQGRKPCTLAYTPCQCHQAIPHCSGISVLLGLCLYCAISSIKCESSALEPCLILLSYLPGQALRSTLKEQFGFSVTDLYLGVLLRIHYRSSQRQEAHTFLKDFA